MEYMNDDTAQFRNSLAGRHNTYFLYIYLYIMIINIVHTVMTYTANNAILIHSKVLIIEEVMIYIYIY